MVFNKITDFIFNKQDSVMNIYFVTMFFAILSPQVFFTTNATFMRSGALMYLLIALPFIKELKKIDFGKNFLKYALVGLVSFLLSSLIFSATTSDLPFTGNVAKFFWFIVVVGMSETILRIAMAKRFGITRSSGLMGFLHIGSYIAMFGLAIGAQLLVLLLISSFAFFFFAQIYAISNNDHGVEAIFHGIYNVVVTGGLI